jgi:hypothetical protein
MSLQLSYVTGRINRIIIIKEQEENERDPERRKIHVVATRDESYSPFPLYSLP